MKSLIHVSASLLNKDLFFVAVQSKQERFAIVNFPKEIKCMIKNFSKQAEVQVKLTINDVGLLEHVLQGVMYLAEGGTLAWYPLPALPHQLVDLGRATGRTLHPVHKHFTQR